MVHCGSVVGLTEVAGPLLGDLGVQFPAAPGVQFGVTVCVEIGWGVSNSWGALPFMVFTA